MNSYPPDWTEDDIQIHLKMQELYKTNKQLIITRSITWEDGTPIEHPILKRQDAYYNEDSKEEKKDEPPTPPQSLRGNN